MKYTLIRGATIVSMDPKIGIVEGGDILIGDDKIIAIDKHIDADNAEIVDARGRFLIPGFIDSHRHVWESLLRNIATDWQGSQYFSGIRGQLGRHFGPDEMYAASLIGVVEALDVGITTVLDWAHNINSEECADAAIQGLIDSGGRVVFALGDSNDMWLPVSDVASNVALAHRIRRDVLSDDDALVTMAMAPRGPEYTTRDVTIKDIQLARELGLKMSIHVGNGAKLAANETPVLILQEENLLGPDMLFIHCNSSTDEELGIIKDAGSPPPSITPDSEVHFGLGWPAAGRLMNLGLRPSLGIDIVINAGGDMFGTFRSLAAMERGKQHEFSKGMPERLQMTSRDLLEMATIEGSRSLWMENKIGTLSPGKQADIVLLKADTLHHTPVNNIYGSIALGSHAGDVDSVLVAGKWVKREGKLTAGVDRIRNLALSALDRVFQKAHDAGEVGPALGGEWFPKPYVRREA